METRRNKIKVLVCAYACQPNGSLPWSGPGEMTLGWNMINQISRFADTHVLTHYDNKSQIEKANSQGISFYYVDLPYFFRFLLKFEGGIQLYAYLWQIKAYFIAKKLHKKNIFNIFHHVTFANDWMASFIGTFIPIPYVRGPGGGAHKIPRNFLKGYPLKNYALEKIRGVGQWIFKHDPFFIAGQNRAKALLVCNKDAYDALREKWQKKAHFFPVNGILKEDMAQDIRYNMQDTRCKVISAGKLLKLKRFDLAIKAFSLFNKKYPNSFLEVIGDGPEEGNLKKLALELNISDKVLFLGWKTREALFKKMRESDVFLFASLRDGGGAVVVEAMSQGKPVVCLDIAGPGFHVKDEWGIKIKPTNPEQTVKDMADALETLCNDAALRERLGRAAKKRAEEFYLWDKLGGKLKEIYDKAII